MSATVAADAYRPAIQQGKIAEWTTGDLLRTIAAEVPDVVALKEPRDPATGTQRTWTYRALLEEAEQVARVLAPLFSPGERVAIWASNRPEWAFLQLGAALAGLIIVPINPAYRASETEYVLRQSRSAGVFYGSRYRDVDAAQIMQSLQPQLPDLRLSVAFEDWDSFRTGPASTAALPQVDPHSPAMILYTSGTTGKPKGAVLAHRAVVNTANFGEARFAMERGSTWLNCLPMFHSSGCVFALMCAMWNRGTHLMLPGFDAKQVLRCIEEDRAEWIAVVPTMVIAILDDPDFRTRDISSLKVVVSGGTSVPAELVKRIERDLGVNYVMVFGQTEMSGVICQTMRHDTDEHRTETVGIPLNFTETRIADVSNGKTLKIGERGEICIRSYATLLEYFDLPDATRSSFDSDGWFHTGDIGTMREDGYLTITGRMKEMVIRGGENIYPREIEDILVAHAAIAEVAVFGIPDEQWGEQLVAAVRLRPGQMLGGDDFKSFLRERIARHKVPAHWWFVDSFPTTASGKIQKFELRTAFLAHRAQVAAA